MALAFIFAFINGFDGGNVIATVISSRSMKPTKAILIATVSEFAGAVLLGTAVAQTVATSIIKPEFLEALPPRNVYLIIMSAMGGAITWQLTTWFFALPSSGSHALIGGLLGSGFMALGSTGLSYEKAVGSVLLPMLIAPIVGSVVGFLLFSLIKNLFSGAHRSISYFFGSAQAPTLVFLAGSHGSNDAQKAMGVIAMTLAVGLNKFEGALPIPDWAIYGCAAAIALGISTGGFRIVKIVGFGIYKLEPVHSFASQVTASSVIMVSSLLGGPVSTGQVVASSVMGVGASSRFAGVRWPMAANIAYAWFLTLPVAVLISGATYFLLDNFA